MVDRLDRFRNLGKPAPAKEAASTSPKETTQPQEQDGYAAFKPADRQTRLRIRRAMGPTRRLRYVDLVDVVDNEPFCTQIGLVFESLIVIIHGRNLDTLTTALENNAVDFIQEYDRDRWPKPADDSAPFIERIDVTVQNKGLSVSEAEDIGATRH